MQVPLLLCFFCCFFVHVFFFVLFIAYSRLHELLLRKCDIAQLVESSTPFLLMYRLYLEVVEESISAVMHSFFHLP